VFLPSLRFVIREVRGVKLSDIVALDWGFVLGRCDDDSDPCCASQATARISIKRNFVGPMMAL
jgi:hypothetical protein